MSWTPVRSGVAWTLYVKDGAPVDVDSVGCGLDLAFEAVEARMGAFTTRVRVHAWNGEAKAEPGRVAPVAQGDGTLREGDSLQIVPGIGPARVRAFHVKGGSMTLEPTGVFLGTCDVGTAVHELVHARLAEDGKRLPLWFEEGLASLFGDGACYGGRWQFDGLACWPMRELRGQTLGDEELGRLLALSANDDYDARQNLLVHFVGWAIVFDLAQEAPGANWKQWLANFAAGADQGDVAAARTRMTRTLATTTDTNWLERLKSEDPAVRFATTKGLWKLRSALAFDRMLDALEHESDLEVKAALAINALLASSETRLGRSRWQRMSSLVYPVLREGKLPIEREHKALGELYTAMRRWDPQRERTSQQVLDDLARYWEE